jgi:hypothetical protein
MRLLVLALTFLILPTFGFAQSSGSVSGLFPSDTTIRVTPWGPGISTYRDLDGNSVTTYQLGPNQSSYYSRDLNGRTSSGYIYNNWTRQPLEPSEPSDYAPPSRSDRSRTDCCR